MADTQYAFPIQSSKIVDNNEKKNIIYTQIDRHISLVYASNDILVFGHFITHHIFPELRTCVLQTIIINIVLRMMRIGDR